MSILIIYIFLHIITLYIVVLKNNIQYIVFFLERCVIENLISGFLILSIRYDKIIDIVINVPSINLKGGII